MTELSSLKGWISNSSISEKDMVADAEIHLKYIDIDKVKSLSPKERVKAIEKHFKGYLEKLLSEFSFKNYKIIGSKKKPRGISVQLKLEDLEDVKKIDVVDWVSIVAVTGAEKINEPKKQKFFFVKVTAAIQIENEKRGKQKYEERFVLIKATSFEAAYEKVEEQSKSYVEPYLNSEGQFVRWKIESFDDCYETDIFSKEDLNDTEAIEVFSVLKSRKLTKERRWDGKSK